MFQTEEVGLWPTMRTTPQTWGYSPKLDRWFDPKIRDWFVSSVLDSVWSPFLLGTVVMLWGASIIRTASQSFDMTCFHYGGPWGSSWCASCADLGFTSCNCQFIPVWTRGCGSLCPGTTATILRSSPYFGCLWFFTIFLWYNGNSIAPFPGSCATGGTELFHLAR